MPSQEQSEAKLKLFKENLKDIVNGISTQKYAELVEIKDHYTKSVDEIRQQNNSANVLKLIEDVDKGLKLLNEKLEREGEEEVSYEGAVEDDELVTSPTPNNQEGMAAKAGDNRSLDDVLGLPPLPSVDSLNPDQSQAFQLQDTLREFLKDIRELEASRRATPHQINVLDKLHEDITLGAVDYLEDPQDEKVKNSFSQFLVGAVETAQKNPALELGGGKDVLNKIIQGFNYFLKSINVDWRIGLYVADAKKEVTDLHLHVGSAGFFEKFNKLKEEKNQPEKDEADEKSGPQ